MSLDTKWVYGGGIGWWTWLTLRVPLLGSPQLLQRIALTVVFLALARVGQFIPVPGVDFAALAKAAAGALLITQNSVGCVFGIIWAFILM